MTKITHFAGDTNTGWDVETGMPTDIHFANAIQVWSTAQDRPTSVQEAALAFNVTPGLVAAAIDAHPWMFVGHDDLIEHDGE